ALARFVVVVHQPAPASPLSPYTTLFRSETNGPSRPRPEHREASAAPTGRRTVHSSMKQGHPIRGGAPPHVRRTRTTSGRGDRSGNRPLLRSCEAVFEDDRGDARTHGWGNGCTRCGPPSADVPPGPGHGTSPPGL